MLRQYDYSKHRNFVNNYLNYLSNTVILDNMKAKIITTQKRSWYKCKYFQLTWMADVKAVISYFSRDKHTQAGFKHFLYSYYLKILACFAYFQKNVFM